MVETICKADLSYSECNSVYLIIYLMENLYIHLNVGLDTIDGMVLTKIKDPSM